MARYVVVNGEAVLREEAQKQAKPLKDEKKNGAPKTGTKASTEPKGGE